MAFVVQNPPSFLFAPSHGGTLVSTKSTRVAIILNPPAGPLRRFDLLQTFDLIQTIPALSILV